MDLKEMIKVMQHYDNGGKVEHRLLSATIWHPIDYPYWDWSTYTYRIAQSPIAADGHNPDKVTVDQLEPQHGWRLLAPAEIKERRSVPGNELQMWMITRWNNGTYHGNDKTTTYRTKLSPAELAKYDRNKQPLSAQDFPPGTAITRGQWNNRNHWLAVLMTSSEGVTLAGKGVPFHLPYNALLDDFYSTDNGKTWRPCYKD